MRKIKTLERKKRGAADDEISEDEDPYADAMMMGSQAQPMVQQFMPQPVPPVQKLSPEFKRRQEVLERQYATLDQA